MAYRKRYEDSYLDDEQDEADGKNLRSANEAVALIQQSSRTEEDMGRISALLDGLSLAARKKTPSGSQALEGLQFVAEAYSAESMPVEATETWARIVEIAEAAGNKELYYYATDKMADAA